MGPHSQTTVLVTGADGFIGRRLCERLTASGAVVHATSRRRGHPSSGALTWHELDLGDVGAVRRVLDVARPDVVFNLASRVAGARELALVLPTFNDNLASTVNVLTVAQELGCRRVVLAGSMEEPSRAGEVASSPYAVAKWAASAYARMFHSLFQTPVVTLRIHMVYGPGQRDLTKLVPYVILALLRGEEARLTQGARMIDWIYVDDVVDALVAAAAADGVEGASVDVGSGSLVSIREVVERLVELTGATVAPAFGARAERPLETMQKADVEGAAAMLGWRPSTSLDEGLARTVAWYAGDRVVAGDQA